MPLVQGGTSAPAMSWGTGVSPGAAQEGDSADLGAAALWDIPETEKG